MKNFITICSISLIMTGCSAKKATTETAETNAEKERTAEIIKEGYIQAVVEDKTKSGCGFVIKNINTQEYLLPNNLEEEYKQDGLKVWLKCRPIRPAQGSCTIGNPTTIEEIKIIE
jgi:uncharacterized protein YceK